MYKFNILITLQKNKEKKFARCEHHTKWKLNKEKCEMDEWATQHGYCLKHICVLCLGNTTSETKQPIIVNGKTQVQEIGDEKIAYHHCNGRNKGGHNRHGTLINYDCSEKYLESLKGEAESRLTNNETNILYLLAESNIESGFKDKIKDFLHGLFEKENKLITNNKSISEPFFTQEGLKQIKDFIDEQGTELDSREKNSLKLVYSESAGNIQNIIDNKITTFTKIGEDRKTKKDRASLQIKRSNFNTQLHHLNGWDLLSYQSQQAFIKEIEKFDEDELEGVIERAKTEIQRIKDNRENPPNPHLPPEPKNPDQPGPNDPSPQPPKGPSNDSPSLQQELNEIKNRIKSTHNLTEEEFNFVISPLTDKNLLEHVSLLLGQVKAVQGRKIIDIDTCLEFLTSYRDAPANSIKKKAHETVNSYQNQVDKIITDLQNKKQIINASLSELVTAENEEKLTLIYGKIKQNSELYQNNDKIIVDNHEQRTRAAIKIESEPGENSEIEKNLAIQLRTIINSDSEQEKLASLAKELNDFKSSSEDQKKVIYSKYSQYVDLMLSEIKNELIRREKSKNNQEEIPTHNNKKNSPESKKPTIPLVVIIVIISIPLIIFSLYLVSRYRKKIKKLKKS